MDYSLEKRKTPISPPTPPQAKPKVGGSKVAPIQSTQPKQPVKSLDRLQVDQPHSDKEIHDILAEGYIHVNRALWDFIPPGAYVRYFKKGSEPRVVRYSPGGFVRGHFSTADGKKMVMLENKPGGKNDAGYISYPVAYDEIEEMWKKYSKEAFVEIHLMVNSLSQKKKQIEELTERVKRLEELTERVKRLEDILRGLVKA